MRKLILFAAALLFVACGVSNKDKEYMEVVLRNTLNECYGHSGVSCMFLDAKISEAKEADGFTDDTRYKGRFTVEFESHDQPVRLYGEAYFNKDFEIVKMPAEYGDNIIGIDISFGTINSTTQIDTRTDSLVLPVFLNHNKFIESNK